MKRMRRPLELDRMAIEEFGPNPTRLAEAIHAQYDNGRRPVPVGEIARALDIHEIRVEPLSNFEGALITTPERGFGSILVNGNVDRRRQTFTIAHELGHFLNIWHRPATEAGGFWCSREDIRVGHWTLRKGLSRHQVQEREANRFAIDLLAPRKLLADDLAQDPDLAHVISIASDLEISREAAGSALCRPASHHRSRSPSATLATCVIGQGASAIADVRSHAATRMPPLPGSRNGTSLSGVEEADPADWLVAPDVGSVWVQTLHQQNGHAMTLVIVDEEPDEDDGVEDAYDRFGRF